VIMAEDSGRLFVSPHVEMLGEVLNTYARGKSRADELDPPAEGFDRSDCAAAAMD